MSMKHTTLATCATICALVAAAMGVACAVDALAQPATVKAAVGEDLRAAFANAADVAEGKRVADTACAGCHSANGVSTNKGVPHLAGQRPAYLYNELKQYQRGARSDAAMGGAVKFLNDDALVKVADYYASVEPPAPLVSNGVKSASTKADSGQANKAATAACSGCHGDTGISKIPGTPSRSGLGRKYLVAAMNAYETGARKNDAMKAVLSASTDSEIADTALFYAMQKATRAPTTASGDQAAGKAAASACSSCHGASGVGNDPATPNLAGQDAQYLAAALHAYKDGSRGETIMKSLASSLDEAAAKNLAAFYANQQPQQPKVNRPLSTAEWVQRCDRCHGVDGNSTDPRMPALAGQRVDYLEKVLQAYRAGERKSSQMAAMSGVLTAADVENLAAFYSRQKSRSVVYVILPAK